MNDIELVNQIKKGNANAYKYLVNKYKKLVFNIAFKLSFDNQNDVEDIAQEVFIKVYKNIKQYRKESKLSTWIAAITWKTAIDFNRKRTRHKINYTDKLEVFENLTFTINKNSNESEIKNIVRETINQLPPNYRTVLTLFYLEEFSYPEIEEITGMPLGTIKSYLNRARKTFKETIENNLGYEVTNLLYNENI